MEASERLAPRFGSCWIGSRRSGGKTWPLAADLASKRPAAACLVLTPISRRPLPLTLALGLGILPVLGAIGLAAGTAADPGAAARASTTANATVTPATPANNPAAPPAWLKRPGANFWDSRPWVYGWYRVHPEVWSWWGPSASRWGLTSLAPAATITALVQAALASGSTVIGVPGGGERLDLASLQPIRPMGVRFQYAAAGQPFSGGRADCQAGLLADQPPVTPVEAQRLNAVCQVTYGNP